MKIVIRAEGGPGIGMGHVMRMLVLADKLKAFAEVVFACRDNKEFEPGVRQIEACGYSVWRFSGETVIDRLAAIGGDCLITDSYDIDEGYFDRTKDIFGITGYMDDINKVRIYADFIINQNIYAEDMEYKAGIGTKLFLGTRYLLLRDEFRNLPKRKTRMHIEDVLITLGGADPGNLSETIALKLSKVFPEITFHIAVGPSFTNRDSIERIAGGNIILHYNPKMSELMLKCDAAISACGSTVYELCACGTPIIGVAAAPNQIMTSRSMDIKGALKYAAGAGEIVQQLESLNYNTRARMSDTARELVDGYGSIRVSEQIWKIICEKEKGGTV